MTRPGKTYIGQFCNRLIDIGLTGMTCYGLRYFVSTDPVFVTNSLINRQELGHAFFYNNY